MNSSADTAHAATPAYSWVRLFFATLCCVLGSGPIMYYSFGVFSVALTKELQANQGELSLALAVGSIAVGIATPLFGWLLDRFNMLTIAVPNLLLLAATLHAISLFADSVTSVLWLYAAFGVFSTMLTPLPFARMIVGVFRQHTGLALGIALSGVGIGAALIPQLVAHSISQWGWRMTYSALAVAVLLIVLPASVLALRGIGPRAASANNGATTGLTTGEALRTRQFWMVTLAFLIMSIACSSVAGQLAPLALDQGASMKQSLLLVSIAGIAVIVGRLLCGALLDYFPSHLVAAALFAPPLLGMLLIAFGNQPLMLMIGAACIGIGLGAEGDLMGYLTRSLFGLRNFSSIYGVLLMLFAFGIAIGPVISGYAIAAKQIPTTLMALSALMLVGMVLVFVYARPAASATAH